MATAAKASLITFKQGDGASPEAFTALAEVVGVPTISMEMGEADATNMGGPVLGGESIAKEYIPTKVVDMGEIALNLNAVLDNASQIALMTTRFLTGSVNNYRIEFPEHARMLTFAAWVKSYEANGDIDAKSNLDVVLRPTGGGAWAAMA